MSTDAHLRDTENVKVVCVSDLHESLIDTPECDLLLIAGDLCYGLRRDLAGQQRFLIGPFADWVRRQPAKQVAVVAGNHDVSVEEWGWPLEPSDCEYLQDSGATLCGLKVWGTPWQPYFYNWGFNAPERNGEEFLAEKFALIPDDTDIVICHGPPRGYGDQVGDPNEPDRNGQPRVGSQAMTDALRRVQPRLMVCGHIHSGFGRWTLHDTDGSKLRTEIVNAAIVDHRYRPVHAPVVLNLPVEPRQMEGTE